MEEVKALIADSWKILTPQEKQKYEVMAAWDKVRYAEALEHHASTSQEEIAFGRNTPQQQNVEPRRQPAKERETKQRPKERETKRLPPPKEPPAAKRLKPAAGTTRRQPGGRPLAPEVAAKKKPMATLWAPATQPSASQGGAWAPAAQPDAGQGGSQLLRGWGTGGFESETF